MPRLQKSIDKRNAILRATLALVTDGGFRATSMAKIAQIANVSPATIYLYFSNKQDLINQLYLTAKKEFSDLAFHDYNANMSIEVGFKTIWHNIANFKLSDSDEAYFLSQCDNTPIVDADTFQEGLTFFEPLMNLWQKGIQEEVLKPISPYLMYAYSIYPINFLISIKSKDIDTFNQLNLDQAFKSAWDSIKL